MFRAFGQLAQLDRAMASGAIGRAFESRIAQFYWNHSDRPPIGPIAQKYFNSHEKRLDKYYKS